MLNKKQRDWILALGYVGFIYATIGIVRFFTQVLRSHNCLRLALRTFYAILLAIIIRQLHCQRIREIWKYFVLALIFSFYFFFGKRVGTPEEEIHFIEYGLVGFLFARALMNHFENRWIISTYALLFSSIAGWIDELLQKLYPSRVYDLKDVLTNVVSAFLGLILFNIIVKNMQCTSINPDKMPRSLKTTR